MDQKSAFELAKSFIQYLKSNDYDVRTAYIFGSYANGKFNENSDIDLAIVLSDVSNSFLAQIQLIKLSRKLDTRIEPHPIDASDFNHSNPFANEIMTRGIQIA